MNAGKLNERVELMELVKANGEYRWKVIDTIWAAAEQKEKTNLFSKVGLGARGAEFVIRRQSLILHDAFRWRGMHCFLTSILDEGKMHLKVAAALVEPVTCVATRPEKVRDEYGAPVNMQRALFSFPGVLTEKYLGRTVLAPQVELTEMLVLVTPKMVELRPGDLVETGRGVYAVTIPHTLDDYKNEYEIIREWEA